MTSTLGVPTRHVPRGRAARSRPRRDRVTVGLVTLLAAGVVLARLPFVARPLSADEGGFLMVAAQWTHGTSLYGSYWVDRPPLLVTIFWLADLVGGGGAVGLRLLGAAWVAASVALAGVLAAVAALLLVSPWFGAGEVDGELLAVPFVLGGLTAALRAHRTGGPGGGR